MIQIGVGEAHAFSFKSELVAVPSWRIRGCCVETVREFVLSRCAQVGGWPRTCVSGGGPRGARSNLTLTPLLYGTEAWHHTTVAQICLRVAPCATSMKPCRSPISNAATPTSPTPSHATHSAQTPLPCMPCPGCDGDATHHASQPLDRNSCPILLNAIRSKRMGPTPSHQTPSGFAPHSFRSLTRCEAQVTPKLAPTMTYSCLVSLVTPQHPPNGKQRSATRWPNKHMTTTEERPPPHRDPQGSRCRSDAPLTPALHADLPPTQNDLTTLPHLRTDTIQVPLSTTPLAPIQHLRLSTPWVREWRGRPRTLIALRHASFGQSGPRAMCPEPCAAPAVFGTDACRRRARRRPWRGLADPALSRRAWLTPHAHLMRHWRAERSQSKSMHIATPQNTHTHIAQSATRPRGGAVPHQEKAWTRGAGLSVPSGEPGHVHRHAPCLQRLSKARQDKYCGRCVALLSLVLEIPAAAHKSPLPGCNRAAQPVEDLPFIPNRRLSGTFVTPRHKYVAVGSDSGEDWHASDRMMRNI